MMRHLCGGSRSFEQSSYLIANLAAMDSGGSRNQRFLYRYFLLLIPAIFRQSFGYACCPRGSLATILQCKLPDCFVWFVGFNSVTLSPTRMLFSEWHGIIKTLLPSCCVFTTATTLVEVMHSTF